MSQSIPRDMSYDGLCQSLKLIEHHITVLEHSPHMVDEVISSVRLVVDDIRTSMRASARESVTSTPYTRKTVYTFESPSPFSVTRRVVRKGDGSARRKLTVVPLEKAVL